MSISGQRSYKEQGIVLHTVRYGDSSLIVYLLTRGKGRQSYMVQEVKSTTGKGNRYAYFQPMFLIEFEGVELSGAQMPRMNDPRALYPLRNIASDARKSTISMFMAEVVYRLVKEVEQNSPMFDFISNCVQALDTIERGSANFHLWFLVRLSSFLGFYPGNEYREGWWFDIAEGVFVPFEPSHKMALSPGSSLILGSLLELGVDELENMQISRSERSEFLSSLLLYFSYHLDSVSEIRSVELLRGVF